MNRYQFTSPYQRPQFFPPVIKWLLILNVGIFLIGMLKIGTYADGSPMLLDHLFLQHGALWPLNSEYFRPWQYITTMFLHGGFLHVGLNMFILWMFGMEIENLWGSKRFLVYYLLSGIGASILHSLMTMSDAVQAPAVGASGAIFGVMIAFGMIFPDRIVFVGFFLPLRAKFAVLLFIAIDLYAGIANVPGDKIAHFAHLGGALTGFILMKTGLHTIIANKLSGRKTGGNLPHTPPPRSTPFSRADQRQSAKIIDARFRDVAEHKPRNAPVSMDFGEDQERIDLILDKISQHGYQSLTEEERELLVKASRTMNG